MDKAKRIISTALSAVMAAAVIFPVSSFSYAENSGTAEQEVTVVDSMKDLAGEAEAADNDPFFTIDVSEGKYSGELATDEISENIDGILSSGERVTEKQDAVEDALDESGYYDTMQNGKSKVEVTSRFASQRIILFSDFDEGLDTHGAVSAAFCDGSYVLSYDSMESAKKAYDALCTEHGSGNVMTDIPLKTESYDDWGAKIMHMDTEKAAAASGDEVIVAVCDTGIRSDHEIFGSGRILKGCNILAGKSNYSRTYTDRSDTDDDIYNNGHGTGVAGIIAGSTPDNVKILPVKIADSEGSSYALDMVSGISCAAEKGADIINVSLGGYTSDENADAVMRLDEKIESLGVPVICSAGNEGLDLDAGYFEFPGELGSTICVSAIGEDEKLCSFSNYGNAIDFSAPGSGLIIAGNGSSNDIVGGQGTSYSAPHISAAAALIKAEQPSADKDEIYGELCNMALDLGDKGRDTEFGFGCPVFGLDNTADEDGSIDSGGLIVSGIVSKTYTGKALTQNPKVRISNKVLTAGTDYTLSYRNNINAGEAVMTISGKGRYSGSKDVTFRIVPKDLYSSIKIKKYQYTYTGKAVLPSTNLKKGIDYTVTGSNNVIVGLANAVITGKGNYSGSVSVKYLIVPKGSGIKKLKRARKALVVKWKKQSSKMSKTRIDGYQIQAATNKKFTKNVKTYTTWGYKRTSGKIAGLKAKKTYYVRIRTFRYIGGYIYPSSWSKAKKKKTR